MWKHEILEKNLFPEMMRQCKNKQKQFFLDVCKVLRSSTTFFIGEYSHYYQITKNVDLTTNELAHLPCDPILFEVYNDHYKVAVTEAVKEGVEVQFYSKKAILCYSLDKDIKVLVGFYYIPEKSVWYMMPTIAMPSISSSTVHFGNVSDNLVVDLKHNQKELMIALQDSIAMTQLINARNIVTKTVVPPAALNKKRVKHHHEPYDKYYILEIANGIVRNKNQGEVPWGYRPPTERALHLCRGHFKTYTEDAKLFGRYTGTFWWQPSIRGNEKNGVVRKDYAVSMTQEEHDA
jgi:hypothetical protein